MYWCIVLLLLIGVTHVQATTYIAATNGSGTSCTLGSPCSLNTGISKLVAGDILLLRGGTYVQGINDNNAPFPSGTSWTNAVWIGAYQNETVILRPTSGGIVIGIGWSTNKYIIFDGLILDAAVAGGTWDPVGGNSTGYGLGVGAGGAHHIRFQNGEIKNSISNLIAVFGDDHEILNSRVHDSQHSYGIYISDGNRCLVEGNEFYNNAGWGIQIYDGGFPTTSTNDNIVRNNRIYNNGAGRGVGAMTVGKGSGSKIYNNLIYNNNGGIDVSNNGTNEQFYYNTLYNNGYAFNVGNNTGTLIKNNIFYNTGSVTNNGSGTVFTKNLCGSAGTGCAVIGNPQFVNQNAGDFHVNSNSAAISQAVAISGISVDFDGNIRPQGVGPDIGAFEFDEGAPPVSPATYYVATNGDDTRNCNTAQDIMQPKQTLGSGMSCLVVAGSTLYLRSGTYTEAIDTGGFTFVGGSDWSTPTTIAAYGNENVTIQAEAINVPVLWFRSNSGNDKYVILDRLKLDCASLIHTNGLAIGSTGHHIRFQNGEIKNCYYEPVYIENSDGNEVLNSSIHDNVTEPCIHYTSGSDGAVVQNNSIFNCAGAGLQSISPNTTGAVIKGNVIHDVGITQSKPGILLTGVLSPILVNNIVYENYAGIVLETGTTNGKVYNNTVYGNSNDGIKIDIGATGTLLTNNISAGNGLGQIVVSGGSTVQTTNLTVSPGFVNAGIGDFHLLDTSLTAIDTGTTLSSDVPKDYEGVNRPQNAAYDIGASEFTGIPSSGSGGVNITVGGNQNERFTGGFLRW